MDRKLRELDQELILAEKRLQVAKNADDVNVPKIKYEYIYICIWHVIFCCDDCMQTCIESVR
jgi:hypothetical protein